MTGAIFSLLSAQDTVMSAKWVPWSSGKSYFIKHQMHISEHCLLITSTNQVSVIQLMPFHCEWEISHGDLEFTPQP